jgi:tellurite resistance protein
VRRCAGRVISGLALLISPAGPLPRPLQVCRLVASPAVLCLAWLQLTGRVDETYRIILFAALFFVLLVLRLWRLAAHSPVSVAWWTYTFPSAALATAVVRYRQQVLGLGPTVLAWGALGMASVVVATVAVASLGALLAIRSPALRVRQEKH